MELEFGSVSFWEEGKTLYPPQRFPMGIPISISNNGKTESAQGTMGRGKRWEKASLLCFPFPSCLAGSFFFFPPSLSSSTQRGFCGGERGKPAEKHIVWAGMKSRNDRWRLHPGSKPGVLHKEVTIGFLSIGIQFRCSQLRFWRFAKLNLFSNSEGTSVCPVHLGLWASGWERQSDPDVGKWDQGENEAADSYGCFFLASCRSRGRYTSRISQPPLQLF